MQFHVISFLSEIRSYLSLIIRELHDALPNLEELEYAGLAVCGREHFLNYVSDASAYYTLGIGGERAQSKKVLKTWFDLNHHSIPSLSIALTTVSRAM